MLHLLLMGLGVLLGAAMGGEHWLWGLGFGFLFAEFVHSRRRLSGLERDMATLHEPRTESRAPTATKADEPSAESVAPPSTSSRPAAEPPPETASSQPETAGSAAAAAPAALLRAAREAEPRPLSLSSWDRAEPAGDTPIVRGARRLWEFFSGGNPLVRVGALVLLVGVAFLLKYLSERVTLPIELRLAGVGAGGIALLLLGIRLHWRRPDFAMPVQGAGLGVLFLTLFAAFRLYQVLPSGAAFALMLVVVAVTVALALWQDALVLAAFGVGGGFMAPILASTGQGSHVDLFTYYLILNAVVVGIAWFRAWRLLNWLGFVFTFGVGLVWGAEYYRPEYFASTEPFLVAHVGLYILVAVLFATRQPPRLKGLVDGSIVFGTPLVGFSIQSALLSDSEYGLAWSAVVLGAAYLVLAAAMWWRDRRHFRLLCECFLALGVGFVTLAVPLAFDARVTSALWCVEGAAVAWVGWRQRRWLPRLGGYALMLLGSFAYLIEDGRAAGTLTFLNADFLGSALVAGAFWFVAWLERGAGNPPIERASWFYALAWWVGGGIYEIYWQLESVAHLGTAVWAHWALVFTSLSLGAAYLVARALDWSEWRRVRVVHALAPGLFLVALAEVELGVLPGWRWAAWLLAFSVQYALLFSERSRAGRTDAACHALSAVSLAALLGYGLWHWARSVWGADAALTVTLPALAPAALAAVIGWRRAAVVWPICAHPVTYRSYAPIPIWGWLLLWLLWVNVTPPPAFALVGFRPLFNVLDLSCLAVLMLLVSHWRRQCHEVRADLVAPGSAAIGMLGFLWLNAALLRALHFVLEIPYRWAPMWASFSVQASVTLLWVVCALGLMIAGARSVSRWVWIAGAALMGAAVLKLFGVDTAGSGTLARIVAFFGVAAALFVAGYLVPRPPPPSRVEEN